MVSMRLPPITAGVAASMRMLQGATAGRWRRAKRYTPPVSRSPATARNTRAPHSFCPRSAYPGMVNQ